MTNLTQTTQGLSLLSRNWKYFIVVGLITGIAGLCAISLPIFAGVAISTLVGISLLVSGIFQAYQTFSIVGWKDKIWFVLSAVLYIIGGLFILTNPLEGLVTITMLMVLVLILNGLTRMFFGFSHRALVSSKLIIVSGLISALIGVYFFTLLDSPEFDLTLLGTFVGVSLLIEGISVTFLGFQMKKTAQ